MRVKWRARDTKVPVDFQFRPQLVRVAPRVFVLKGTMNAIGATEVHAGNRRGAVGAGGRLPRRDSPQRPGLHAAGHPVVLPVVAEPEPGHDHHAGRGLGDPAARSAAGLGRKIDMSQDKDMYSFTAPKYTVTLWFNPCDPNDCPINVQDRIGWLGEGMTDSDPSVIDTSGLIPGDVSAPIPGLKILKKTFTLTRDDILGKGRGPAAGRYRPSPCRMTV